MRLSTIRLLPGKREWGERERSVPGTRIAGWSQGADGPNIGAAASDGKCMTMTSLGFARGFAVVGLLAGATAPALADDMIAKFAGIAFVDSSVTSQGSRARLPEGAKIYPPDAKVTGTEGCPTTRYRTDGLIVAVFDYVGRPTAGSLTVTRHPAAGGRFENAPYYLDINQGRTLQFLGPIFDNGTYDMRLTWGFGGAQNPATSASFTLARSCPQVR